MKILILAISLILFLGCGSNNKDPEISNKFSNVECSNFDINRTDLECGYLEVPNDYFNKSISFELPVVIKRAEKNTTVKSPIVFERGGPTEGGALESLDSILSALSVFNDRDIIVYNRRGEQYSSSYLSCNDVNLSSYNNILKELYDNNLTVHNLTQDQYNSIYKDVFRSDIQECINSLESKGFYVKDFTTRNSGYDIESLRVSLGYESINLLGISYGTRLSLEYMQLYPKNLDSVILDGVLPENSDFLQHQVLQRKEALERFFEVCKNDTQCNNAYPNFKEEFLFVADSLTEKPFFYTVLENNETQEYHIDGTTLFFKFYEFLYDRVFYKDIPYITHRIYNEILVNDYTYLEYLSKSFTEQNEDEDLIFDFIHQQDYPVFLNTLLEKQEELGEYKNSYTIFYILSQANLHDLYNGLQVEIKHSYNSNVPTLILTGSLDPVTPVSYAQSIDSRLNNSTNLIFNNNGHSQLYGDCGILAVEEFFNNKDDFTPPDCVYDENPIDFYVPNQ